MNAASELPLFPLSTVLFPGGPLRLRIFEPRYLDMVRRCLRESRAFYTHVTASYEDAGWVGNRWAEVLPLTSAEKQQLLELADPLARLEQVAVWSTRQPPTTHV